MKNNMHSARVTAVSGNCDRISVTDTHSLYLYKDNLL
jgi:hypothetical protein